MTDAVAMSADIEDDDPLLMFPKSHAVTMLIAVQFVRDMLIEADQTDTMSSSKFRSEARARGLANRFLLSDEMDSVNNAMVRPIGEDEEADVEIIDRPELVAQ